MEKKYIIPIIVLTGGPCGGKTEILGRFKKLLKKLGFVAVIIPETATIIMSREEKNNITLTNIERQRQIAKHQIAQEEKYLAKAEKLVAEGKKPIIICDRALIDNKAYCTDEEWKILQSEFPALEHNHLYYERYHGAIFLPTAPKPYYNRKNKVRKEGTHREARKVNDATFKVYLPFEDLTHIGNPGGYEKKKLKADHALVHKVKRVHNSK